MLRVFKATKPFMAAAKATQNAASQASEVSPAPSGIQKPRPISATLRKFVGQPEISRAQAIKKVWDHVKLHQLQNPSDKREIICDEKLKAIFDGKDKVGMFEISKFLAPHFLKSS